MKTLQESIIGRKGTSTRFTKNMLKPGYIVKYRNNQFGEFNMYFGLEDIEKYQDTKTLEISHIIGNLRRYNDMGVFISKEKHKIYPEWSPLLYYSEDLCSKSGDSDFDIVEIYPIKIKPKLLDLESLEKLIKDVNPIKINQ